MKTPTLDRVDRKIKNVDWWNEPQTYGVVADPKRGRGQRRLIKIYLWTAAILLPVTLCSVLLLAVRSVTPPPTAPTNGDQAAGSVETARAQVAVEAWLKSDPAPLPGGRIVAFTGTHSADVPARDGSEPRRLVAYSFVLADQSGRMYQTSIQMVHTADGAASTASPALIPLASGRGEQGQVEWPWPGVEPGTTTDVYEQAVAAWAKAYTSGNPAALKLAIGDPAADRHYVPLAGVTFADPAIGEVGALWAEDQDRSTAAAPRQVLLRVTTNAVWAPATEGAPLTYDLLLDRADTAAPVVVAWGAPGAALAAYSNAVHRAPTEEPTRTPPSQPASPQASRK